jgi:hypothetical protein
VEPAGSAQIRVVLTHNNNRFDLRYYGSDDYVVPQWWVGATNAAGELTQTDVLSAAKQTSVDLTRWLTTIVGAASAGELVRRAVEASLLKDGRIAS